MPRADSMTATATIVAGTRHCAARLTRCHDEKAIWSK